MTGELKILMIDPWVGNDYSVFLASALSEQNVNVSLVVNEDRDIQADKFSLLKIMPSKNREWSKIKKLFKYLLYLRELYITAGRGDYSVIHFQAFRRKRIEAFFFYLLSFKNIPLAFTVHDVEPLDWSRTDKLLNNLIYRSASLLAVHSLTNKKMLLQNYNAKESKIAIVPHGSFENTYPQTGMTQQQAREKLGLSPDQNILLIFGAVKEYKGIDLLIEAASEASDSVKNLVLIIAGKGEGETLEAEYLDKITKLRSSLLVLPHFRFIENNEVEMYYRASDISVLPYRIISHSGVLHVSYSFAVPVIASRSGDFEEFVIEGKTGYLFNSGDSSELCSVIKKAFSDKENLIKMGICAQEINNSSYTWGNSAEKLKTKYEILASGYK